MKIDKPRVNRLRLRIRRQGQQFSLSYQIPGTAQWTLLREEELTGFPEIAELGLVGYTHFPGNAPAMRPDLLVKFSEIYIYSIADFSRSVKFNLAEELSKGMHSYSIPGLFP